MRSAPDPPDPDEYDLLVTLAYLDDSVGGNLSSNRHTLTNHYILTKENNEQTY
jgi:hypothetical protein